MCATKSIKQGYDRYIPYLSSTPKNKYRRRCFANGFKKGFYSFKETTALEEVE
jgi:hypothetical protein